MGLEIVVEAGDDLSIRARGQAITGPLSEFPEAHSEPDGPPYNGPASGEILLAVNDNLGFDLDNEAGFATQMGAG